MHIWSVFINKLEIQFKIEISGSSDSSTAERQRHHHHGELCIYTKAISKTYNQIQTSVILTT
jgi:hypothetical protein